jgi:hypothetical protein
MSRTPPDEIRRQLLRIALENGWYQGEHRHNEQVQIFRRGFWKLHVRYRDMTVTTEIWHPRWHKMTRLSREKVSMELFARIAAKPRVHTGRGAYE